MLLQPLFLLIAASPAKSPFTTCCRGSSLPPSFLFGNAPEVGAEPWAGGRGKQVAARFLRLPGGFSAPSPHGNSASHFLGMFQGQPESVIAAVSLGHLC